MASVSATLFFFHRILQDKKAYISNTVQLKCFFLEPPFFFKPSYHLTQTDFPSLARHCNRWWWESAEILSSIIGNNQIDPADQSSIIIGKSIEKKSVDKKHSHHVCCGQHENKTTRRGPWEPTWVSLRSLHALSICFAFIYSSNLSDRSE